MLGAHIATVLGGIAMFIFDWDRFKSVVHERLLFKYVFPCYSTTLSVGCNVSLRYH